LQLIAQRRAELIADKIQGTTQLLYGLARARDPESPDRDACSVFLTKVLAANPQYTGLITIKPDGSLFCDSLRSGRQLDLRDRGYFKAAQTLAEGVAIEPVFGRITGIAVMQTAHPVRSAQGQLLFVLLALLNLKALAEPASFSVPGASLLLVDERGTVMATSRTDAAREVPGSSIAATPLFEFMLAAVPKQMLVASADRRLAQDLTLLALMAAAVFLGVWMLAERAIRRPVERISRMASRSAAGDLAARIETPLPRGEMGDLMRVLNQTAESLQQQRQDIAELNERLRQSQRLEAVGQLTGGVAHDFNNLLTVVMGNAELLTELNRDDARQRVLAEMISTAAQRGAELTQRLLAFARKQALAPRVVDLNALVAGLHRERHRPPRPARRGRAVAGQAVPAQRTGSRGARGTGQHRMIAARGVAPPAATPGPRRPASSS